MNIIQSFLTKNPCYKAGKKNSGKGAMLHSIGCPQPDAQVFVKGWNSESHTNSCVHAFIDGNTGDVYQTLPWDMRAWHCASGKNGSGNNTHIGVEMCEPACIKYTSGSTFTCSDLEEARAVAKRTYTSAVELFAKLCKENNWDPLEDGVILGHAEGYKRGIASNHGDPEHLWKQLGLSYTMDTFRADVKKALGGSTESTTTTKKYYRVRKSWDDAASQLGAYESLENAKKDCKKGYIVFDWNGKMVYVNGSFKVRVDIDDLNIRKGPGTSYAKTGKKTGKGTFTIVEVYDGWGLLVSYQRTRNGWISLDYAKQVI